MSVLERYLRQEEWASIVRDQKETGDAYTIERIAQEVLRYIRYTRIRQYNLFTQRRGEDFETMLARLESMGFELETVRELVADDTFWNATLRLAED